MDECVAFVVERKMIVDVEIAGGLERGRESNVQRVRIVLHLRRGTARAFFTRNDGSAALEHRDFRQRRIDVDKTSGGRGDSRESIDIIPKLRGRKIHRNRNSACGGDRFDEEIRSDEELVVHVKSSGVGRIVDPKRAHDGCTSFVGVIKLSVPIGEKSVASAKGASDVGGIGFSEKPRFSARAIEMCMTAEKWLVCTGLIPTCQKFGTW